MGATVYADYRTSGVRGSEQRQDCVGYIARQPYPPQWGRADDMVSDCLIIRKILAPAGLDQAWRHGVHPDRRPKDVCEQSGEMLDACLAHRIRN